jgi:hypothetical protein
MFGLALDWYKVVSKAVPAVVDILWEVGKAAGKESAGGKKIVPDEWEKIKAVAIGKFSVLLDGAFAGFVG